MTWWDVFCQTLPACSVQLSSNRHGIPDLCPNWQTTPWHLVLHTFLHVGFNKMEPAKGLCPSAQICQARKTGYQSGCIFFWAGPGRPGTFGQVRVPWRHSLGSHQSRSSMKQFIGRSYKICSLEQKQLLHWCRASRRINITSHIMYCNVGSFAYCSIWHSFTTVPRSLAQLCLCVHATCNKQFREPLFGRHRELLCDSAKSISIWVSRSALTLQWAYQPNHGHSNHDQHKMTKQTCMLYGTHFI